MSGLSNKECSHSMVENLCGLCIRDARIKELEDGIKDLISERNYMRNESDNGELYEAMGRLEKLVTKEQSK